MSYLIKHLGPYKAVLSILILLVSVQLTHGQLVTGPSPVNPNSTHTYNFDTGTIYSPKLKWTVTGGSVLSAGKNGTEYFVNVQWGAAGTGTVTCKSGLILLGGKTVIIGSGPAAPPMPTVTKFPGYTRLTRTTPPTGEYWYWQSSSSGTSTSSPSYYIDRPYGTTQYFLRAYESSSNQWSTATTINYTVDPPNPSPTTNLSDENYVYTISPRIATTDITSIVDEHKIESATYFDGLGRGMQSVGIRAGGNGEDIITHVTYDSYGRQTKDYLPYALATNYGAYKTNALTATNTFYNTTKYENTTNPFSEKDIEASPLNRVLKQAAPGYDWRMGGNNEVEFDYQTNPGTEVKRFEVNTTASVSNNITTYNPSLSLDTSSGNNNGYYNAGELYKTITNDENWTSGNANTIIEFKDIQGRVILKRNYGTSKVGNTTYTNVAHDTYYIYDIYGNLTYVLPPKMDASTASLTTINAQMNDLGYQYKYDNLNRLVEKRIPGKDWEYTIYDRLDRPVLIQDRNLRDDNKWLFTKYDALGRVAYTGEMTRNISRTALQNEVTNTASQYVTKSGSYIFIDGTKIYYNNSAYPTSYITDILTINYYDNYTFDGFTNMPEISGGQAIINYNNATGTQKLTKGLVTGTKVRVLSTTSWITTYTGYDGKGRPIYVKSVNDYLITTDIVESTLDFTGAVDKTVTSHEKGGTNVITEDIYTYDHAGRLEKQTQELDNTDVLELIVDNTYDDLGQLTTKKVGHLASSSLRLQTVNYTYNIRGWLKGINNEGGSNSAVTLGSGDVFGLQINYNNPSTGISLFNGNISQTLWKTTSTNPAPSNPVSNKYTYTYDAMNRIVSAMDNTGRYDVQGITYDKNGNIRSLIRDGKTHATNNTFGVMDNLTYNYVNSGISNQLLNVSDGGSTEGFKNGISTTTEYEYDQNGNMLKDKNKGINSNIEYNHLNLPTKVYLSSGNISYFYDATGAKLKKIISNGGTTTEYASNYVYEGGSLKFFNHPEGYVEPDGSGSYDYVYQYKDHLGNVRLSYQDSNNNGYITSSEILEENNYYPFGLKHKGYNVNIGSTNIALKKTYNGKEFQDELGLNWHDYGARNYDASLGRWMNVDPLSFQYSNISPFAFVANMPTIAIDPDGKRIIIVGNENYVNQVKWQLALLATTEEGSRQVLELAGSKDDVVISNFGEKGNSFLESREKEDGTKNHFVNYLPGLKSDLADGTKRNPTSSLSHELGHVEDAINGLPDNYKWRATTEAAYDKTERSTIIGEINTVHRENLVRAGLSLDLRKTYDGIPIMNMQVGLQRYFGPEGDETARYLFELLQKPEEMHFDYSSVPKAAKKYYSQTANGVKPYSSTTNLKEWSAKRQGFSKFNTNYNTSDKATVLEAKKSN